MDWGDVTITGVEGLTLGLFGPGASALKTGVRAMSSLVRVVSQKVCKKTITHPIF